MGPILYWTVVPETGQAAGGSGIAEVGAAFRWLVGSFKSGGHRYGHPSKRAGCGLRSDFRRS